VQERERERERESAESLAEDEQFPELTETSSEALLQMNNNLRGSGEEGAIKSQRRLLLCPSHCSPHEDDNRNGRKRRKKTTTVGGGGEGTTSLCWCRSMQNSWQVYFAWQARADIESRWRETEGRAGYDLKALIFVQISLF